MKFLKKFLLWFMILFILLNGAILVSGRTYLYKALWNTYFKGRSGPSIDEYQIFYNRKVETGIPQDWPVGKDYNIKKIPDSLRLHFDDMETIAFLVIQNDSLRYEEYWDGFSDTSHTNSFSMAKTITGILAGIAIDEGKIASLDQPVGDILPEFKTGENGKLTIRHLITMCSAIDWDESYKSPFAYPAQAYYGNDLKKLHAKYKVAGEPGKIFEYRSGNTQMLAFILEKTTGKTLSEYASEKLWKPLGSSHYAYWSLDHENGIEKAYCCFNSNAKDFARIGQLYLDSGRWQGRQIVSEEYVLESIEPAPLKESNGSVNRRYGYSWWLLPDYNGHRVFYARGILGQYIFVIPDKKMVAVRLGKKREKEREYSYPKDVDWYLNAALGICDDTGL